MEGGVNKVNKNEDNDKSVVSSVSIESQDTTAAPIWNLILVAAIAAGIQFGWALQLSLLTPYVQLLGISHDTAPIIWLCGPISGMVVQPFVGFYSDNCKSRFGRRRPFIAAGTALVAIAVILIGFAADIGHQSGDLLGKVKKPRAIGVFIVGFAILDVANNMLQGPCRALLADLSGLDARKTRMSYAGFSFFMAVGNVLGYAAGAYSKMYHIFPFTKTVACDVYCANLKSCFLLAIALLLTITILALTLVREKPLSEIQQSDIDGVKEGDEKVKSKTPFVGEILAALKDMSRPMWILLLVTCFNWIGWFPFILFDTDWTGREIYGSTSGNDLYDRGVRMGSLGLLLNSLVLAVTSVSTEHMSRLVGGVKRLWGIVNFLLAICLALTVLVSKLADSTRRANGLPSAGVKAGTLALFSVMGIPLSITYSIPFALASIFSSSSGSGQGLSLGVLNLAIVVPQMIVSLIAGHWDSLFGGGNLPAFVAGAVAAALSGIFALFLLPSPPQDAVAKTKSLGGGFH